MEDHKVLIEFLKWFIPVVVAIASFVYTVMVISKIKIPKIESDNVKRDEKIKDLEKGAATMITRDDLIKWLYDPDGNPRFQPVAMCLSMREFCGKENKLLTSNLGKEIQGVGDRMVTALKDSEERRTLLQQENAAKFDKLAENIEKTNIVLVQLSERQQNTAKDVDSLSGNNHSESNFVEMSKHLAKSIVTELRSAHIK